MRLSICPSVPPSMSVPLCVRLSVCWYRPSTRLSIRTYSVVLSVCLSVCTHVRTVCLSVLLYRPPVLSSECTHLPCTVRPSVRVYVGTVRACPSVSARPIISNSHLPVHTTTLYTTTSMAIIITICNCTSVRRFVCTSLVIHSTTPEM